jgi:hypothetical protein
MGAEQPNWGKASTKTHISFLSLLAGAAVLFVALVIFTKVNFNTESDAPKLKPQEEAKLQKRLKEIDEAQQYALVANNDGWYPCNHVGRTTFHLLPGEIWKYGTTSKGQFRRYSVRYLEKTNVSYVIQFEGTISECLKEEQRKLFFYPFMPENFARPEKDRLPRPPYNSKMQ